MITPELDADLLRSCIGRTIESRDSMMPSLVERFCATFDLPIVPRCGEAAPPAIHWCLAPTAANTASLGADGHPERGGFLPPVPLPRRMWAGGELLCHRPLRVGDEVRRVSQIEDVTIKHGRTGPLCFVIVRHTIGTEDGPAIVERQDLVFRGPEPPRSASTGPVPQSQLAAAPKPAQFTRRLTPGPVLLFRYSALTFNAHRIHYDRRYCQDEEGYPGLVVHGPLQASLLLQLAIESRGGVWPTRFAFRSTAPVFDDGSLTLNADQDGADLKLWTSGSSSRPAMTAEAHWGEGLTDTGAVA